MEEGPDNLVLALLRKIDRIERRLEIADVH
jgi:hypothetical protein